MGAVPAEAACGAVVAGAEVGWAAAWVGAGAPGVVAAVVGGGAAGGVPPVRAMAVCVAKLSSWPITSSVTPGSGNSPSGTVGEAALCGAWEAGLSQAANPMMRMTVARSSRKRFLFILSLLIEITH